MAGRTRQRRQSRRRRAVSLPDGGLTWSPRVKVNATPTNIPIGNQQAFTPSVDVAADGTVAVTYYDFRNNTDAPPLLTDYFVVHCHAACNNAESWGGEIQLTEASFDMRQAPMQVASSRVTTRLASVGSDFGRSSGRRTAPTRKHLLQRRRSVGARLACPARSQRVGQARPADARGSSPPSAGLAPGHGRSLLRGPSSCRPRGGS